MVKTLTPDHVRQARLYAQGLTGASVLAGAAETVRHLCAVQSQEPASAYLAIRARTAGLVEDDINHAREIERSIVLTWTLRGTMQLVTADDLQWQLQLVGPLFIRKTERRYKQLGLDEATRAKAAQIMRDALSVQGPLTRAQLADVLATHNIPAEGQAIPHLLRYAALQGLLCFGPERDGEQTYVVLEEWLESGISRQLSEEHAVTELARRYLQANAPATPHDFASWSGLGVRQAKAGFEALANDLVEVQIPGSPAWMLNNQIQYLDHAADQHSVRLLPRYDNYLLGHQSRDFMVQDEFAKAIHPGGGLIRSSLIVDGLAQGIWRLERKRQSAVIELEAFETIAPDILEQVEAEAADLGCFLGLDTRLTVTVR